MDDTVQGATWRINTATGDYTMTFNDPTIKPRDEVALVVNGVHIHNSELYFTKLATSSVGKVILLPEGSAASKTQILTTEALTADDFALPGNSVVYSAGAKTLWQVSVTQAVRWSKALHPRGLVGLQR